MELSQNDNQLELNLSIAVAKEIDGVEMGVLSDATPFLSGRGLARACGVSNSTIVDWGEFTPQIGDSFRAGKMAELLAGYEFRGARFFERIPNGIQFGVEATISAYPDLVCMAFLEYYAFEAGKRCTAQARQLYRRLGREKLRDFIYRMVDYKPANPEAIELQSWQNLKTRIALNSMPIGYFSVLEESYPLELKIIRHGLIFDQHTVPDISIGGTWGRRWAQNMFDEKYGKRIKHPHIYPDSYAQSKFNGKHDYWVYPIEAIGEFKKWLQIEYAAVKLPKYLKDKVKAGVLQASDAQVLLNAVNPPQLRSVS